MGRPIRFAGVTSGGAPYGVLWEEALRTYLAGLRAEEDAATWEAVPLSENERALEGVAEWGPAEDWSEWGDETR